MEERPDIEDIQVNNSGELDTPYQTNNMEPNDIPDVELQEEIPHVDVQLLNSSEPFLFPDCSTLNQIPTSEEQLTGQPSDMSTDIPTDIPTDSFGYVESVGTDSIITPAKFNEDIPENNVNSEILPTEEQLPQQIGGYNIESVAINQEDLIGGVEVPPAEPIPTPELPSLPKPQIPSHTPPQIPTQMEQLSSEMSQQEMNKLLPPSLPQKPIIPPKQQSPQIPDRPAPQVPQQQPPPQIPNRPVPQLPARPIPALPSQPPQLPGKRAPPQLPTQPPQLPARPTPSQPPQLPVRPVAQMSQPPQLPTRPPPPQLPGKPTQPPQLPTQPPQLPIRPPPPQLPNKPTLPPQLPGRPAPPPLPTGAKPVLPAKPPPLPPQMHNPYAPPYPIVNVSNESKTLPNAVAVPELPPQIPAKQSTITPLLPPKPSLQNDEIPPNISTELPLQEQHHENIPEPDKQCIIESIEHTPHTEEHNLPDENESVNNIISQESSVPLESDLLITDPTIIDASISDPNTSASVTEPEINTDIPDSSNTDLPAMN